MDADDLDKYSRDLKPISAIPRPERKQKVGDDERHVLTSADIAAKRLDAWDKQRQAHKERPRAGGGAAVVLEDMTAAADMELAAHGVPFSLKLVRNEDIFNWVLLIESDERRGEIAARSKTFSLISDTPKAIASLLKEFLTSNIG